MDFFGYYTMESPAQKPFIMFSITHLLFLILILCCIFLGLKISKDYDEEKIKKFEKIVSLFLICCEFIYYIWNIFKCPYPIFTEILPLHLCSICIWTSFLAFWLDNEKLRHFIAVNNMLGALIALCYPATIASINQAFSYRVIYFFISHGTITFMGVMQLRQLKSLSFQDLKFNIPMLAFLTMIAMGVNYLLHSNYLFVGFPSSIPIIQIIYDFVGILFYLPVAILIFSILEILMLFILKNILQFIYNRQSNIIFN